MYIYILQIGWLYATYHLFKKKQETPIWYPLNNQGFVDGVNNLHWKTAASEAKTVIFWTVGSTNSWVTNPPEGFCGWKCPRGHTWITQAYLT